MGHEIFLKIIDGSQNIFLCSPLVILAQNAQTGYQGDLRKVRNIHSTGIRQVMVTIKKENDSFLPCC